MRTAEIIRQSVTMKDLCEKYEFVPNKQQFITCPFHSEKTASLKLYENGRGWHCFGCGKGGSVIDFVENLFNISFWEAVELINDDFALGLPLKRRASYRELAGMRKKISGSIRKAESEKKSIQREQSEYDRLMDIYVWADIITNLLKPKKPEDEIFDIYKEAVGKKVIAEYMLDCLGGTT